MVEPLRHRQTKEAATDMFCLKPPRHISTLHLTDKPPVPEFVAYWTNNGQKAALGLDLSAAIDPYRPFASISCCSAPGPYQSIRLRRTILPPEQRGRHEAAGISRFHSWSGGLGC
jgi:hypothetical protein